MLYCQGRASRSRAFGGFHDAYKRMSRRRSPQRQYNFTLRYDFHLSQQSFYFIKFPVNSKSINVPTRKKSVADRKNASITFPFTSNDASK